MDTLTDVMQVCRNGHVITDRLRSDPQSGRFHCDRCGASTLDHCSTCGGLLPGAGSVPDLVPIGLWPAPRSCPLCGAAFPWARKRQIGPEPLSTLEQILRRLPLVIRQLRWRQTDRPPFSVENERDLEDLLRSLLPLRFDEVRLECRTPAYSPGTRTDVVLAAEKIALTVKYARSSLREPQLLELCQEDVAYYRRRGGCRWLICYLHDPEGFFRDPGGLESMVSQIAEDIGTRCIIGGT